MNETTEKRRIVVVTAEWWKEYAPTANIEYEHVHHEGFLKTS